MNVILEVCLPTNKLVGSTYKIVRRKVLAKEELPKVRATRINQDRDTNL